MKKKIIILIIALFLSIGLISCTFISLAKSDVILSDNFQSGNLNAWTTYQSSTLTINSQTTNNGESYSVQCTVSNGQNSNIDYKQLPSVTNPIDYREYVYVNSITAPTAPGDYYQVGGFSTNTGPNYGDGEIIVTNVDGTLYWGLFYRDATGSFNPSGFSRSISTFNTTGTAVPVTAGQWTCLELSQTTGDVGVKNGIEQLYVNGQLVVDVSTAQNGDRTPYNAIIGGSQLITSLGSGTINYYISDVVVDSSYIGTNQNTLTISSNAGTVTPSTGSSYAEGQQVSITATAPTTAPQGERYVFNGWVGSGSGSYTGSNNPAQITMNSAVTETATWNINTS